MDRFKKGNKCVFCRSYGVDLQNSELRDIFYHADCRKNYVHKKTLRNYDSDNLKKAKLCSYVDDDMPSERMS